MPIHNSLNNFGITSDTGLVPSNLKSGVTVSGVQGNLPASDISKPYFSSLYLGAYSNASDINYNGESDGMFLISVNNSTGGIYQCYLITYTGSQYMLTENLGVQINGILRSSNYFLCWSASGLYRYNIPASATGSTTQAKAWQVFTGYTSACILPNGNIAALRNNGTTLDIVNPSTGAYIATYTLSKTCTTITADLSSNAVYCYSGNSGSYVLKIDGTTGTQIWSTNLTASNYGMFNMFATTTGLYLCLSWVGVKGFKLDLSTGSIINNNITLDSTSGDTLYMMTDSVGNIYTAYGTGVALWGNETINSTSSTANYSSSNSMYKTGKKLSKVYGGFFINGGGTMYRYVNGYGLL